MGPDEYETAVADHFRAHGYSVTQTPARNDYGVDAIAENSTVRIAIQAKMYGDTTRRVNRQTLMELCGAMHYFDCNKAVLATDGELLPSAEEVANKLGIEILRLDFKGTPKPSSKKLSQFDEIWNGTIVPLEGKQLERGNGKSNRILKVDGSGVIRETSNGRKQRIEIEIFRKAIEHLLREGRITRDEINQEYSKRASSGIVLILSQVPQFELTTNPVALRLRH